jgi:hypothetical protein
MASHGAVAARVRAAKERDPEYFCRAPGCLWRVLGHSDDGRVTPLSEPCPKHPVKREVCEHCGREIAVTDDGEMHWQDPRCATLCWSDERQAKFCDRDPKRPGAPHRRDCRCDDCYVDQD